MTSNTYKSFVNLTKVLLDYIVGCFRHQLLVGLV